MNHASPRSGTKWEDQPKLSEELLPVLHDEPRRLTPPKLACEPQAIALVHVVRVRCAREILGRLVRNVRREAL